MSHRTFQFRLHDQPDRRGDAGLGRRAWSAAFSLLLDKAADGSVRQGTDAVALAAMRTRMERSPVARNLSPTMQKRIDVAWTN